MLAANNRLTSSPQLVAFAPHLRPRGSRGPPGCLSAIDTATRTTRPSSAAPGRRSAIPTNVRPREAAADRLASWSPSGSPSTAGRTSGSSRCSPRASSSSRNSTTAPLLHLEPLRRAEPVRNGRGGGVPEPLLPPQIALQNPELIGGLLVLRLPGTRPASSMMIDSDGDENYQPISSRSRAASPSRSAAGDPRRLRSHCVRRATRTATLRVLRLRVARRALFTVSQMRPRTGEVREARPEPVRAIPAAWTADHTRVVLSRRVLHGRFDALRARRRGRAACCTERRSMSAKRQRTCRRNGFAGRARHGVRDRASLRRHALFETAGLRLPRRSTAPLSSSP